MLILLGKLQNLLPKSVLAPKLQAPQDHRDIEKHLSQPIYGLVSADDAASQFPDRRVPVVPGAPPTTGLAQVAYDGQASWDRSDGVVNVGPVRSFFAGMIKAKNSVRQM